MQKKTRIIVITSSVVAALLLIFLGIWYFFLRDNNTSSSNEVVNVSSVADIAGLNARLQNRYSGVVEPQETLEIKRDEERTVKESFVQEGDKVEVGTPLFAYDTDEIDLKLSQAELDLEQLSNEISTLNSQIALLEKDKANASADEKLAYTTQIQTAQNDVKRAEYNQKSKTVEIEQIKKSLENSTVVSSIAGVVKTISESGVNMNGEATAYMTILATGDYRIKGKINEQNTWVISEGQPVMIRSRVDLEKTWTGMITLIDYDNKVSNENNYYYSSSGGEEQSSFYPFYIELDTSEDLILGQHVYIELSQEEAKTGIWIHSSYFVFEDSETFAWVMNSKEKLEKRKVKLGDYDESLEEYQVLEGLTKDEYIAWPEERLENGLTCVISGEEGGDGSGMADEMPAENNPEEMMPDEYNGEGMEVPPMDDAAANADAEIKESAESMTEGAQ